MGRISISSKTENVIGNLNLNYHVAKGIVYFDSNGKVIKTIFTIVVALIALVNFYNAIVGFTA